ncbi:uncharacterized protein LOC111865429 [Cryptotermes secundus]|uniref:uncharacterized protein LOC111865429 n=1 Tax=Cryptotermes secundus TaxID=105785 RepID=UPI000CD7AB06|nr:uncharacterized protein LOC111865429 [Cryptotermes secundus]XP_023709228.1 uncharacterized protein LOC111865429 [Cryptotermes secundus]XP_023709229.1 uncharacterized protein LOC111865429 [Cryptotermes secundus]XP_023709230.1 uncharacterized protein LOC111865429 [Cryptotermes secundus]
MSETETSRSARPEILMWFLSRSIFVWQQIVLGAQRIMRELHTSEFLDMTAVYLVQHPIMALFLISVALCCGIPVLMFVLFAVLTVVLTFAGFIVVEGTILTVGSVLLCGFLLGMLVVMLTLAATVGVAYFGFMEIYGLLHSHPENSPVSHYLSSTVLKPDYSVCPQRSPMNVSQQQHDNHHED